MAHGPAAAVTETAVPVVIYSQVAEGSLRLIAWFSLLQLFKASLGVFQG